MAKISDADLLPWCRTLLLADPGRKEISLEDYLSSIPRLSSLGDVPAGTPVIVRGDLDAKVGAKIGDGDVRLRSMEQTLRFGRERGWKLVIIGHIGRKPEGSLKGVARRLGEILSTETLFLEEWLDPSTNSILPAIPQAIQGLGPGGIAVLENTRRYPVERLLWDAAPEDLPKLVAPLARLANEFAEKIGKVYVNEALSAGSLDSSTTILPASMDRVALGHYVAKEFDEPMRRCLDASLVVFSGLKTDKLDDLEAMIRRGRVRVIFSAGSLAMALKKADALLRGQTYSLGVAEDPKNADKDWYISPERVEQAKRMLQSGRKQDMEFVLPIDYVIQDGTVVSSLGPSSQQFDIGPNSRELFASKIDEFIAAGQKAGGSRRVAFHNGVFGKFEDPQFEGGTRHFIQQLHRLKQAGVEVYIGGGEGGTALEKYGQPDWVTHCFTAGGTVLNALGSNPVPYLQALSMAASRKAT